MKKTRSWRTVFFLVDVALIDLAYFLAFTLKFPQGVPHSNWAAFVKTIPYISFLAFILLWGFELYVDSLHRPASSLTGIALVAVLLNIGAMAMAFWFRGFAFPRTVFALAFLLQVVLLAVWRWIWWAVRREGAKRVLVVGNNGEAAILASRLAEYVGNRARVTAADQTAAAGENTLPGVETVLSPETWRDWEQSLGESDVVYVTGSVSNERREAVVAWCVNQDKEVYLVPGLYEIMLHDAAITWLGAQPVLGIEGLTLSPVQQLVKRSEDLILGVMLGAVGVVAAPFIVLAIKLTSPGPVLYRQVRTGQDGKSFSIYKFRTMVANAEQKTGPVLATENDPRITPVGRFLRATRLDEIPQVLNILKGDMSFVGPRPERPVFVEQFTEKIPAYPYRFKVKPGITGLAQVKGSYDTDTADKLRYDLYYIRNYSLWLDFKILLQTVRVVLTPEAARGVSVKDN